MLNENPNETESAPKKSVVKLVFGFLIIAFGLLILVSGITGIFDNKSRLKTPNGSIIIESVGTPELRQLGLSGRKSIADNYGMLFVFDTESIDRCFWMKDMKFPIDMIWLNSKKEVITVTNNVSPQTYPESFCPDSPAKYGLEIKANTSDELDIHVNEKLKF